MSKKISAKALLDLNARHERSNLSKQSDLTPILALDYGEKFCGFAVAPDGQTVLPAAVVSADKLESALNSLVESYKIKQLVIGLPVSSDGTENHICKQIKQLGAKLEKQLSAVKISLVNERFSTQAVLSPDKERIDDLAAMQILEFYLASVKS